MSRTFIAIAAAIVLGFVWLNSESTPKASAGSGELSAALRSAKPSLLVFEASW